METIPHIAYRIRTTLRIACARLVDLSRLTVWDAGDDTLVLSARAERDDDNERAYIDLRLEEFSAEIEGWHVSIGRGDTPISWHKGALMAHSDLSGEMIGALGDERAAALAIEEVRRLLPQLQARLARHNWERPHVRIDITAVRADEVVVSAMAWQSIPAGALDGLAAGIRRIWRDAEPLPAGGLTGYPIREDDERLSALDEDSRKIIVYVNQGRQPAQIARLMGLDDSYSRVQMNKRVNRLRRRYPHIVMPARRGSKRIKRDQSGY